MIRPNRHFPQLPVIGQHKISLKRFWFFVDANTRRKRREKMREQVRVNLTDDVMICFLKVHWQKRKVHYEYFIFITQLIKVLRPYYVDNIFIRLGNK